MTFKLKLKKDKRPGMFVGTKFRAADGKIYTITSYNYSEQNGIWFYRRDNGAGTQEELHFIYTEEEVINNLTNFWKLI